MAVRCRACGREDEWPQPEFGCATCGTVARIPVHPLPPTPGHGHAHGPAAADDAGAGGGCAAGGPADADSAGGVGGAGAARGFGTSRAWTAGDIGDAAAAGRAGGTEGADSPGAAGAAGHGGAAGGASGAGAAGGVVGLGGGAGNGAGGVPPARGPLPPAVAAPRPDFQPVTIRTGRDAVTAAALYLRWLGFRDVRQPERRPASGIDLRAPGLVAQVDPSTRPAVLRDIECLWLNGLTTSAVSVFFSLAGYTDEARARADDLGIPLFVMDLTGVPQPVNDPADELLSTGA
ncbi:hypothetical protein [Streptomyces sp. SYSU K217416]